MRYSELIESEQDIAALIRRDCSKYLANNSAPMDWIMWRGIADKDEDEDFFGKQTARLTDRRPTSSKYGQHKIVNGFFVKHFKYPFRNAVFTTGEEDAAESYGTPYAIFPIGDYEILWHPDIGDMFIWLDGNVKPQDEVIAKLEDAMDGFRTDGIKEAIASHSEIMLYTSEYYYVSRDAMENLTL
jgi:hypothetical protein